MIQEKQLCELIETHEAICATSIENSMLIRQIFRLVPRGKPMVDYLGNDKEIYSKRADGPFVSTVLARKYRILELWTRFAEHDKAGSAGQGRMASRSTSSTSPSSSATS